MATKLWAVLLVLFTTFLTSSAQLLWKKGSANLSYDIFSVLTNYYLIGGILIYAIAGILLIISLRGGEVSVLYPIIATSYIWVSFLSINLLGEKMNNFRWFGVLFIISGIALIGLGSTSQSPAAI